jgi:hypothetical protein
VWVLLSTLGLVLEILLIVRLGRRATGRYESDRIVRSRERRRPAAQPSADTST